MCETWTPEDSGGATFTSSDDLLQLFLHFYTKVFCVLYVFVVETVLSPAAGETNCSCAASSRRLHIYYMIVNIIVLWTESFPFEDSVSSVCFKVFKWKHWCLCPVFRNECKWKKFFKKSESEICPLTSPSVLCRRHFGVCLCVLFYIPDTDF